MFHKKTAAIYNSSYITHVTMDEKQQQQQQQQGEEQEMMRGLNPHKLRSRMDSEDFFPPAYGGDGDDDDGDLENAEEVSSASSVRAWRLEIPQEEDEYAYGNDDENGFVKPQRKMTSNSEATSATAASSFYDEQAVDNHNNANAANAEAEGGKLDKLPEGEVEDEASAEEDSSVEINPTDGCCWKWTKRMLGFWIIFGLLGLLVVLIGAAIEKREFYEAEDTKNLYKTDNVCGIDSLVKESSNSTTYSTVQEAHETGDMIAHCGHCGACSTAHDLEIMAKTTESLTGDSARCAFKIFIGRRAVEKCMEERIGFTPDCEDCWLDNIACSFRTCKFTCIKWKLFRQDNNNGVGLNDCLKCDERMCGPQFIECSGSNRRRMGIVSDIGRDADMEQCPDVDIDWLSLYA